MIAVAVLQVQQLQNTHGAFRYLQVTKMRWKLDVAETLSTFQTHTARANQVLKFGKVSRLAIV